jgi:hypothetical protein
LLFPPQFFGDKFDAIAVDKRRLSSSSSHPLPAFFVNDYSIRLAGDCRSTVASATVDDRYVMRRQATSASRGIFSGFVKH